MRISDWSSDVCSSDLRDFRQAADDAGVDRDASTFGGTVGAEFDPGGKLRGELNVGVFRFDPKDRTLKPYTGLQFAAAMSYAIRPRTSITLDAFRGDVAPVRTVALARPDTDRKSLLYVKSVSVRLDLLFRRLLYKKIYYHLPLLF